MQLTLETETVIQIIKEAGQAALAMQDNVESHLKADGSPVSEGDKKANDIIVAGLQTAFPEDAILSEEIEDNHLRLNAKRVWIIDPIDGTSSYIAQRNEWAVQIALAVHGRLVLGALFIAQTQTIYLGIPGEGAWRYDETLQRIPCEIIEPEQPILLCSKSKRNRHAMKKAKEILSEFSNDSVSSVGLKAVYLLEGRGSIYANPSPIHEWDYAAPAALLLAAGGHASDFHNQPLPINGPSTVCDGVVLSNRGDHGNLVDRLQDLQT